MLRNWIGLLAITCVGLLALAPSAPTQGKKAPKVETPKEQLQEERIQKMVTAFDLAAQGHDKQAPEFLIAAAGIMRQLSSIKDLQNIRKLDAKVEVSGSNKKATELEAELLPLAKQSEQWFNEASAIGANIKINVDPLIKEAKARAAAEESKLPDEQRAVVGGPQAVSRYSAKGQVDLFTVTLIKQYPTAFGFTSTAPLHVSVVHGTTVWVNGTTTALQRTFAPASTNRTITIRVQNLSKEQVQYQMFVN